MIPHLIHQTARTREIPEKWKHFQQKVQDLHPGWKYTLWTDTDNETFVKQEYPEFADIYFRLPVNIMRVDVIRYLILYRFGGVYMDLDYEMLRPFDLTQYRLVMPLEVDIYPEAPFGQLGNAFMACEPGSLFFKAVIDELKANPPTSADQDPVAVTGPLFLTKIFNSRPEVREGAFTPERIQFCPPVPKRGKDHRALAARPDVYAIHYCHGSWRSFGLLWKIKSRVEKTIIRVIDPLPHD